MRTQIILGRLAFEAIWALGLAIILYTFMGDSPLESSPMEDLTKVFQVGFIACVISVVTGRAVFSRI